MARSNRACAVPWLVIDSTAGATARGTLTGCLGHRAVRQREISDAILSPLYRGHWTTNRGGILRKLVTLVAALAAAVTITITPAGAITGNFTPDNVHNYVALVAFYDANGDFVWRCSGSLLNDRTVLTAGHCTDKKGGAASAIVWASQEGGKLFDPATGAEDPNTGYPNECLNSAAFPCAESHTLVEYGYIGNVFLHGNNKDVGMVILDTPIALDEYASIAAPGSVDKLPVGTSITYSGYGVSDEKPAVVSFRERLMATGFIVSTH